jgi:hypothetical protein
MIPRKINSSMMANEMMGKIDATSNCEFHFRSIHAFIEYNTMSKIIGTIPMNKPVPNSFNIYESMEKPIVAYDPPRNSSDAIIPRRSIINVIGCPSICKKVASMMIPNTHREIPNMTLVIQEFFI